MKSLTFVALLLITSFTLSGCAPLLLAGGAVGGYAIAKNSEDRKSSANSR